MSGKYLVVADTFSFEEMSRGCAFICHLGFEGIEYVFVDKQNEDVTHYCSSLIPLAVSNSEAICLNKHDRDIFCLLMEKYPAAGFVINGHTSLPEEHLSRVFVLHIEGTLDSVFKHQMEEVAIELFVMTIIQDTKLISELHAYFPDLHQDVQNYLRGGWGDSNEVARLLDEFLSERRAA